LTEVAHGQAILDLGQEPAADAVARAKRQAHPRRRANELDGATWTRYSISVWRDVRKTPEEVALKHPALFPKALVSRLIQCFLAPGDKVVLDPFMGVGSTPIAAAELGKVGIGIELSEEYFTKAGRRPIQTHADVTVREPPRFIRDDANNLLKHVPPASVDLVVTSPPYWDILLQKRTADYKPIRHYGDEDKDLGKIQDYHAFLFSVQKVFKQVWEVLKPGKYCCVVVMDIRKGNRLYPYHADLANYLEQMHFHLEDIIIWDRSHEYNNLRPLGYPSVFRVNKVHEYILVLRKPPESPYALPSRLP
jgi:DNA modification methylase